MKHNKPIKVNSYYRGGSTTTIHLHKTKFQVFKELVVKRFKQAMWLGAISGAVYLIFLTGKSLGNETIINKVEAEDTLTSKVETLKNEVVETIRKCEAINYTEEDALITFDPDPRQPNKNVPSIGEFQYKALTVKSYYKILYGQDITLKQATLIALDTDKARTLTKDIIFKDSGKGIANWYNCMNKHNLKQKVGIIKELSN